MIEIDTAKLGIELINSTMGKNDLPAEIVDRLATALVLMDHQEGEDLESAVTSAYAFINKDIEEVETVLDRHSKLTAEEKDDKSEKPSVTGALKENAGKVKSQPKKTAGKSEQSL